MSIVKQHPETMSEPQVVRFLEFLAIERKVTPSTQRTALNAIAFLYKKYLGRSDFELGEFKQARRPGKLPVVLTRDEVRLLLSHLEPPHALCGQLMSGSGLRLMEVCRLRVKDVDMPRLPVTVREGKGNKQRITTFAHTCVASLERQLAIVEIYWQEDRAVPDWGGVYLPFALERKYPKAPFELAWQYLFPARSRTLPVQRLVVVRQDLGNLGTGELLRRRDDTCSLLIVLGRVPWGALPLFAGKESSSTAFNQQGSR